MALASNPSFSANPKQMTIADQTSPREKERTLHVVDNLLFGLLLGE
jgi:hypothetical protein